MLVLGIEPASSGRIVSALNCRAISPVWRDFKEHAMLYSIQMKEKHLALTNSQEKV